MDALRAVRDFPSRHRIRIAAAVVLGIVWWTAVLKLTLQPGPAGFVDGVLAAGGWGLGLIPLHTTERVRRNGRRAAPPPLLAGERSARTPVV